MTDLRPTTAAFAPLDAHKFHSDLTINLLRRPVGKWICLDARTALGAEGGGLAESALYDAHGLFGRARQSLTVRSRAS